LLFVISNIPYFFVKVNALYRSLIFFVRTVHFQQCFFSDINIINNSKIHKLQFGNIPFLFIIQNQKLDFIAIAHITKESVKNYSIFAQYS